MRSKNQRKSTIMMRVRLFQISGIALITLCILNTLFLKAIGLVINTMLFLAGLMQFWVSFRLWQRFYRLSRQR